MIEFEKERETKGTWRYKEVNADGSPVIGTIYVQKWASRLFDGGQLPDRFALQVLTD